jgi:hypothetical protein
MAHNSHHLRHDHTEYIEMPAPSFWPMVMAFGLTMLLGGLVTHYVVSIIGFIVLMRAAVGWWRDVIPKELHEHIPIRLPEEWAAPVRTSGRSIARLQVGVEHHRMHYPEQVHPYMAGVWGGLAGGVVMAVLACGYGLIFQHSIWYPINLLAAMAIPSIGDQSVAGLRSFNALNFVVGLIAHGIVSILVGVLYAVTLPMFPRRAPLWAGFIVPLFWTALVAGTLNLTNPELNAHINWVSFIICQLGFGLTAGFVAAKTQRIDTMQHLPFARRAGLEGQWEGPDSDQSNSNKEGQ